MDFNLNDEQELFVAGIRELMASENWEAYFAECDRDSVYPERFVKALADMGIDSLLIPEEHGGLEAGFVTVAAVWMELGRLGAPTYVLYQLPGGFNTFLREGTQEQIDKIMAFRGTGKQMWNSAITEPGAGSDVGSLKTTYTRKMVRFISMAVSALSPVVPIPRTSWSWRETVHRRINRFTPSGLWT